MSDFMRAYRQEERKNRKKKQKYILGEWRECVPIKAGVCVCGGRRTCIMNVKYRASNKNGS